MVARERPPTPLDVQLASPETQTTGTQAIAERTEKAATVDVPVPDFVAELILGEATADDLLNVEPGRPVLLRNFTKDQLSALQNLMGEAYARVAQHYRDRLTTASEALGPPLLVPVVYVLESFSQLGAAVVGRVNATGAVFVDYDEWQAVLDNLVAIEPYAMW